MNQSGYERRARVGRLVYRAQVELAKALGRALAHLDISAAQYAVLSSLVSGRADTGAHLCKDIFYSPGAMTRMLDRLENKRMIRRTRNLENRRSVKLEPTEEGKAIFPASRVVVRRVVDRFFGAFSLSELKAFEAMLKKLMAGR